MQSSLHIFKKKSKKDSNSDSDSPNCKTKDLTLIEAEEKKKKKECSRVDLLGVKKNKDSILEDDIDLENNACLEERGEERGDGNDLGLKGSVCSFGSTLMGNVDWIGFMKEKREGQESEGKEEEESNTKGEGEGGGQPISSRKASKTQTHLQDF